MSLSAVIDLETTGLDPGGHVVLEIGCLIVDRDVRPLDQGVSVVVHHAPDDIRKRAIEKVRRMHTDNGLIDASAQSPLTLVEAEAVVLNYLAGHARPRTVRMMNNNAPFERRWLATHLPTMQEWLHHRNLDVSSVRELCRTWFPAVHESCPRGHDIRHRAMPDVMSCIAELRHYLDHLRMVPLGVEDELPPDPPTDAVVSRDNRGLGGVDPHNTNPVLRHS